MSRIAIAPIVEGQGDEAAVRILLQRTWSEILGGEHADVCKPIRRSRGRLFRETSGDLEKAIDLALLKLAGRGRGLVLILVDAEDDCRTMGSLGPLLLARARQHRADADIACVIANIMFETWFVAAAESLGDYLNVGNQGIVPSDPEASRYGKSWIKSRMRSGKYAETADQAPLASRIDLALCRRRSKPFDKLCRMLNERIA